jgi:hypothetical protein
LTDLGELYKDNTNIAKEKETFSNVDVTIS